MKAGSGHGMALSDQQFKILTELYDEGEMRDDFYNFRQRRTLETLRRLGMVERLSHYKGFNQRQRGWKINAAGVKKWESERERRNERAEKDPSVD